MKKLIVELIAKGKKSSKKELTCCPDVNSIVSELFGGRQKTIVNTKGNSITVQSQKEYKGKKGLLSVLKMEGKLTNLGFTSRKSEYPVTITSKGKVPILVAENHFYSNEYINAKVVISTYRMEGKKEPYYTVTIHGKKSALG